MSDQKVDTLSTLFHENAKFRELYTLCHKDIKNPLNHLDFSKNYMYFTLGNCQTDTVDRIKSLCMLSKGKYLSYKSLIKPSID